MNNGMNDSQNTLTGKVIKILDVISGDKRNNPGEKWYRQEFVIETYAQYPRQVCFSIWGEDRIKAANLQLGEDVTVTFELSSREYQERWYTSAEARNVMRVGNNQQAPGYYPGMPNQGFQQPQQGYGAGFPQQGGNGNLPNTNVQFGPQKGPQNDDGDDLPF